MENHHAILNSINGLGFLESTKATEDNQFYCLKDGVKTILSWEEYRDTQRKRFGKAYWQFKFRGASFDFEGAEYGCEEFDPTLASNATGDGI